MSHTSHTPHDSSAMDNILMITMINTITATFASTITRLVEGVFTLISKYVSILYDKFLDWRYGRMLKYVDCKISFTKKKPPVAKYFFDYIQDTYKFRSKQYACDKDIVKDDSEIGDNYIGATFTSERLSDKDGDGGTCHENTFTFYSRLHTEEEFIKICNDINDKASKKISGACIISDVDGYVEANNRYYIFDDTMETPYNTEAVDVINHIIETNTHANFLLYGPPGTGKTNIIKYVAKELDATMILLNLNKFNNINQIRSILNTRKFFAHDVGTGTDYSIEPKKRIYVFEDFDTALPKSFWSGSDESLNVMIKKNIQSRYDDDDDDDDNSNGRVDSFTYSELLNLLDGIIKNIGAYVFFTTNHINHIDSAFYRPGRMHLKMHIGALTIGQIRSFISKKYDDAGQSINDVEIERCATLAECYSLANITKDAREFIHRINTKYLETLGTDVEDTPPADDVDYMI